MVRVVHCNCGAVKVTIYREPFWASNCHCNRCRKFLHEHTDDKEAAFNGFAFFWAPDLKVEGEIFWKDSLSVKRGCCAKCRQVVWTKGKQCYRIVKLLNPAMAGVAPTSNIYFPFATKEGAAITKHLRSYGWPRWATIDCLPTYGDCGSYNAVTLHLLRDMLRCGCCCWHNCGREAKPHIAVPGQMMLEVATAAHLKPETILERRPDGRGGLKVVPIKPEVVLPDATTDSAAVPANKMERS